MILLVPTWLDKSITSSFSSSATFLHFQVGLLLLKEQINNTQKNQNHPIHFP